MISPKSPRLRLASHLYDNLRQQVFHRDGWRCQSCGTMLNLEVHHKNCAADQEMIQSRT